MFLKLYLAQTSQKQANNTYFLTVEAQNRFVRILILPGHLGLRDLLVKFTKIYFPIFFRQKRLPAHWTAPLVTYVHFLEAVTVYHVATVELWDLAGWWVHLILTDDTFVVANSLDAPKETNQKVNSKLNCSRPPGCLYAWNGESWRATDFLQLNYQT